MEANGATSSVKAAATTATAIAFSRMRFLHEMAHAALHINPSLSQFYFEALRDEATASAIELHESFTRTICPCPLPPFFASPINAPPFCHALSYCLHHALRYCHRQTSNESLCKTHSPHSCRNCSAPALPLCSSVTITSTARAKASGSSGAMQRRLHRAPADFEGSAATSRRRCKNVAVFSCGVCKKSTALNGSMKLSRSNRLPPLACFTPTPSVLNPASAANRTPSAASVRAPVSSSPSATSSGTVKFRSPASFSSPSISQTPSHSNRGSVVGSGGLGATPSSSKKKKKMSLESAAAAASSLVTSAPATPNGNLRPPPVSPTPRFNSGTFLSGARPSGNGNAAAAALGVFGANAGKGGLFSSLNQIFGPGLR